MHPQVSNLRLPGPGMMSTWSELTLLNWGQYPQLRQERTKMLDEEVGSKTPGQLGTNKNSGRADN